MALPQGIAFRGSAGYVTDPANYDYSINGASRVVYPWTTAQGNSVGWEVAADADINGIDRNSGTDPRLAGIVIHQSAATMDFRIDLPSAGNYRVGLAAGDYNTGAPVKVDLYDNSSLLASLSTGSTSGAATFNDATDTEYSDTNWVSSQTLVQYTFSSTICRFRLLADAGFSRMASLYIEEVAAVGGGTPIIQRILRSNLIWR